MKVISLLLEILFCKGGGEEEETRVDEGRTDRQTKSQLKRLSFLQHSFTTSYVFANNHRKITSNKSQIMSLKIRKFSAL